VQSRPHHERPLARRAAAGLVALALALVALAVILWAGPSGRGLAQAIDPYRVEVVQTSAGLSQRMTPLPDFDFGRAGAAAAPVIRVNAAARGQRVQGFGAAMTDSSAWLMEHDLTPAARQGLMSDFFGAGGIHLNFIRLPIGASDFTHTGQPYSYDDLPPGQTDPRLAKFSIAHDDAYILPALQQARTLNPAIDILATPWSPPAWMKANRSLDNAGNRGTLLRSDYGPWAQYIVKFIQAYTQAGIPIAALTPQNEPGVATLYPGLNLSAASEANWVVHDLKPALARARLAPRIYGADLGWGPTTTYATDTAQSQAARDLAGLAWHCYFGAPTAMDADRALASIVDECSPGLTPTPISEVVISSLRNRASSVALWNLALDPSGGPAQLPNHGCMGCSGLVTIDPRTGAVTPKLAYYQLGQASAFVAPGAQRVASPTFVHYRYPGPGVDVATPGLDDVALRNPDGSLVLMAYDNSARPIRFSVAWRGRAFSYRLPAGATVTFMWNRP
jgi:glucosylceramidase